MGILTRTFHHDFFVIKATKSGNHKVGIHTSSSDHSRVWWPGNTCDSGQVYQSVFSWLE